MLLSLPDKAAPLNELQNIVFSLTFKLDAVVQILRLGETDFPELQKPAG
jgi:hypothetical protein